MPRIPRKPAFDPIALVHVGDQGTKVVGNTETVVRAVMGAPHWHSLVWYPQDTNLLTRRQLQLWAWRPNANSYLVLKPPVVDGRSTRRAVVVLTSAHPEPESRHINDDDPMQFGDEVPTTKCAVFYVQGADLVAVHDQEVPNGLMLRYLGAPGGIGAPDITAFCSKPLADTMWDYTGEHPDYPGVRQPGPPCLASELPLPVAPKRRNVEFSDFDE